MSFIQSRAKLNAGPLTNDQIMSLAPSVFAAEAHGSRSERYTHIPTSTILDGMRANGFMPTFAQQGRSRTPGKAEYTKHMLKFSYAGELPVAHNGVGAAPQVCMMNSHDGTRAFKLVAGLIRFACLNGLIVAEDGTSSSVTARHTGNIVDQVIEGSFEVLAESRRALGHAEEWSGITLIRDEQVALAEQVHALRFPAVEGKASTPFKPEQLLEVRRQADIRSDLWTTTNVLQENAIRGGLSARTRTSTGQRRNVTSRPVNGIEGNVALNQALWALTQRMAEIKGANA